MSDEAKCQHEDRYRGVFFAKNGCIACQCEREAHRASEAESRIAELEQQLAEHDASFQLRWDADQRAIKRWQDATGRTMTWPDHADLCVWLMEQLAAERERSRRWERLFSALHVHGITYLGDWRIAYGHDGWYAWLVTDTTQRKGPFVSALFAHDAIEAYEREQEKGQGAT